MAGIVNPFLRGQYAQQQATEQADQSQLSGLATMMKLQQAQQEQPYRIELLKAQAADMAAKPEDRRLALENNRNMALARLQQAASQFETNMGLKMRSITNAEEKAAWDREYQQGRLALEAAARQQGAERLFYDTGIRTTVPGVPPAQPPAAGLESLVPRPTAPVPASPGALDPRSVSASVNAAFPLTAQAAAAAEGANIQRRELMPNGGGMLPSGPLLAPGRAAAMPTATNAPAAPEAPVNAPAAPLPVSAAAQPGVPPLPQMPQFVGSPREQAAARNRWLQEQAKIGGGSANAGDYTKTGDAFLGTIPEADRAFVKKLAGYDIDPKTLSTRGGERERYLKMASQFDPTFDQKNYTTISSAINRFATGQQGNTVRSLNVAIDHMDTARDLAKALKNRDIPIINRLANEIATQTGKAPPTTFEAVKEIVADEVVKGVIGNSGALGDREAAAAKLKASSSPEQFTGVLDAWTKLMGGQMRGLERQYAGATNRKDFRERYLLPRTKEAIGQAEGHAPEAAPQGRRPLSAFGG